MNSDTPPILEARQIRKEFVRPSQLLNWKQRDSVRAVEDVSLAVAAKETLALVGESGSGKSTMARMLLWLEIPSDGKVLFDGQDLSEASEVQLRRYRASVQAVFQDPWSSLNPRMRIRHIVGEPLVLAKRPRSEILERVRSALSDVGLTPDCLERFPHEFSGGQRQRVALARAIVLRPRLLILDEPLSSLDVSVRAQMVNLLVDLQSSFALSYLFISHDLATVRYLAARVAVMYLGRVVELAGAEAMFTEPLHPYTEELIEAARWKRPEKGQSFARPHGQDRPPAGHQGCPFLSRCPKQFGRCHEAAPALRQVAAGRYVACHLH